MSEFFQNIPSKWRGWAYVVLAVVTAGFGIAQTVVAAMAAAAADGTVVWAAVTAAVLNYLTSFVGITARLNLSPDTAPAVVDEAVENAQDAFDSTDETEE